MAEYATTEAEFKTRYAAHMQREGGLNAEAAQAAAQAGWEQALSYNDNNPDKALSDLTPEEAVDEEMTCWND